MPASAKQLPPVRPLSARDLAVAGAMVGASVLATFEAWQDVARVASRDEELSYVLLAPVVIAWLVWVRRGRLRGAAVRRGWVGLPVMLFGWLAYWYGFHFDPAIWRGGAVVLAVGTCVVAVGGDVAMRLLPALAACAFLVPIDPTGRYHLAGPMETVTAQATQSACDVLGIYVERAGNLLTINGHDVTIAEACNGMRMIMTLFMVCYVVAFSRPLGAVARTLLLIASPLVAIGSNVVRLVPTVWMFGHYSEAAAERFHDVSGWVMTVLAYLFLMGALALLQRLIASLSADGPRQPAPRRATVSLPEPATAGAAGAAS